MRRLPFLLLFLFFVGNHKGHATVLQVPDPYPLIQAALDACADGDTVLVAPGHYHERLVIPDRNLTLGSHALITGDTLFIRETIIDGDSLGQVIRTSLGSYHNRLVVNGFTIRGAMNNQQSRGGGIEIRDDTDVALHNLYFERNYSTWDGACIYVVGTYDSPRVELLNIQGRDNQASSAVFKLIEVVAERTAILDGLRFSDLSCGLLYFMGGADTCIVRNVYCSDGTCSTAIGAGTSSSSADVYLEYDNINVSRMQWQGSRLLVLGGFAPAIIKNIRLIDNVRIGDREQDGHLLYSILRGCSLVDSLIFRRNRGAVVGATGGILKSWAFPPNYEPVHGVISNLIMKDNVLGDSTYTPWGSVDRPAMLTTEAYCFDGAMVRNNTVIATPGPDSPAWGELAANLIRTTTQLTDSSTFRNMRFENNLVIDRDDNESILHWANEGRCLFIGPNYCDFFLADSLVFDHNLQPNMCTEEPYGGEFSDGQDVGSVFQVSNDWENDVAPPKYFLNLIFRGNQDGGFRARDEVDLRVSNVQMIDMHRQGLDLQAQRVELDNVLIDGCESYAHIAVRSEQMPLRLEVTDSSVVRNCTIINCTTPYVVMAGLRYPDSDPGPIVHFENCLFANNQYDRFEALISNYTGTPGWDPYVSGEFNNCLLQEAPDVGADNLIGVDPLFDSVWGAPYLAVNSPCIDAGTPGVLYNDVEDPGQLGFALWPSQGTLRNDIGVTGGPLAAVIDTNWVGIGSYAPRIRLKDFALGSPYPNPFNPVTRIPFALTRPMPVRLVVHNLLGQEVAVLVDRVLPAGTHQVAWRPTHLANGVYIMSLAAGSRIESRSIILLK